jgi:predicted outer membrane repeat protein
MLYNKNANMIFVFFISNQSGTDDGGGGGHFT